MHPVMMTEIAKSRMEDRRAEAAGRRARGQRSWRWAIGLRLVGAGWRIAGGPAATNQIEVRT